MKPLVDLDAAGARLEVAGCWLGPPPGATAKIGKNRKAAAKIYFVGAPVKAGWQGQLGEMGRPKEARKARCAPAFAQGPGVSPDAMWCSDRPEDGAGRETSDGRKQK